MKKIFIVLSILIMLCGAFAFAMVLNQPTNVQIEHIEQVATPSASLSATSTPSATPRNVIIRSNTITQPSPVVQQVPAPVNNSQTTTVVQPNPTPQPTASSTPSPSPEGGIHIPLPSINLPILKELL